MKEKKQKKVHKHQNKKLLPNCANAVQENFTSKFEKKEEEKNPLKIKYLSH